MAINNLIAQGMQPFNAANTLALSEDIKGARTQNAIEQLFLEREQNPNSLLNRGREVNLNAAAEQLRAAQLQNALPALTSAQQMLRSVRETTERKGAVAGRQMLNRQLFTLKDQGILPEDFDLGLDPSALSDDEFLQDVTQSEQDFASLLSGLPVAEERAPPAAIREMQSLGYPMTREGFQQYNEDRGSGTQEGLESLLAEARLRGLLMDQDRAQTEAEREREEREQERTVQRQSIERNLNQNMEAVRLTESLEGTMLESGLPASDFRRGLASVSALVSGLAGRDKSELTQTLADFDTQRKILEEQVNARIASGDYGRSATQLQSIQRSLASNEISAPAIIRIQGQLAEIDLDRADALGLDIENREEFERRAKEWKSYDPVSSNISSMSREQIAQLDIDSLTDEEAEAALKRLEELGQ